MASLALRTLIAGGLLAGAVAAYPATTTLMVRAVIKHRVSVQMMESPPALQVTQRDLAAGYVDAPAPLAVAVSSNSRQGVLLLFTATSEHVQHTEIMGPQGAVRLGAAGGALLVPQVQPRAVVSLRFRFFLAPTTPVGTYAWPLQLSAES